MYEQTTARKGRTASAHIQRLTSATLTALCVSLLATPMAHAEILASSSPSVIRKISSPNEKLEITTNTSRILTLEKRIPRVQVNNPDLLSVTPLSATQVQISAKKAGVTAINLWDEDGNIHVVDVFVYGDVRELEHALKTQFPNSSVRVYRYSQSLVLTGFIDRPDYVTPIVELAQDYSPKVINNISVGGVQQVLLKVKVFEVSRSKLRRLGHDGTFLQSSGGFFTTGVSGLIANTTNGGPGALQSIIDTGGQTVEFGIVNGGNQFFGLLDALQQNNLAKILAEPNIVAVSGRPAQFNEGGEIPIVVPQSLGTASIEFKKFGTQVDFLPIVLGNGNIRLEVRPRISELDSSNGVTLQNVQIPALTVREVDTAVEMKAGQTFALAGLIQRRTKSVNRGLPYLSDVPILGVPFRKVEEEVNEIELLILVTPEFVDAMDPHQVPRCYPGSGTMSPDNCELYWGGHVEVPNRCNGCSPCGCVPTHGHEPCCPDGALGVDRQHAGGYCGSGYDGSGQSAYGMTGSVGPELPIGQAGSPTPMMAPGGETLQGMPLNAEPLNAAPTGGVPVNGFPMNGTPINGMPMESVPAVPTGNPATPSNPVHGELSMPPRPAEFDSGATTPSGGPILGARPAQGPGRPAARHYSASRRPAYQRQASNPFNPTRSSGASTTPNERTGLIGPVGYDAE